MIHLIRPERMLIVVLLTVCLSFAGTPLELPAHAAPQNGPNSPEEVEDFFDSQIETQLETEHIPGAVAILVKDGTVFFSKGYGYASLEKQSPVDPERTLFRIASITKLFTWTAVMQQVEEGRLDLDADINAYLDFTIPPAFDEPVTLRHLMAHTAGFEDRNFETVASSPEKLMPLGDWLRTHLPARVRRPGELSAYSNYGADLAGYMVERVSGMSYDTYIREKILTPLGMARTSTLQPLPAGLAADFTPGYVCRDGSCQPEAFQLLQGAPAWSMSATASDMARFMIAHLRNGELAGLRVIGHTGSLSVFQAILALIPDQNLGLFLAYNGSGILPENLLEVFLDRFYPGDEPALAAPGNLDHAAQAAGYYRSTRSSHTTVEKVKQLFSPFRVSATPQGRLIFPTRGKPMEYVEIAPLLFRAVESGEFIVFRTDDRGQIAYIFQNNTPIRAYVRLAWYESPRLHAGLMVSSLLVLFLALPLTGFRWVARQRRSIPQSRLAKLGWSVLIVQALLAFVSGPLVGIQFIDMMPFIRGEVTLIRLSMLIPYAMILLAAAQAVIAVVAWRKTYWSPGLRAYYSAAALASVLLIGVLAFWNMIGWKF